MRPTTLPVSRMRADYWGMRKNMECACIFFDEREKATTVREDIGSITSGKGCTPMNETAKQYMTRREAAEYVTRKGLPFSYNTFQKFAAVGGGPTFRHFGKRVFYVAADLDVWISENLSAPMRSTSERAA